MVLHRHVVHCTRYGCYSPSEYSRAAALLVQGVPARIKYKRTPEDQERYRFEESSLPLFVFFVLRAPATPAFRPRNHGTTYRAICCCAVRPAHSFPDSFHLVPYCTPCLATLTGFFFRMAGRPHVSPAKCARSWMDFVRPPSPPLPSKVTRAGSYGSGKKLAHVQARWVGGRGRCYLDLHLIRFSFKNP